MSNPLRLRVDPDEILVKAIDKVVFEEHLTEKEIYCAKATLHTVLAWYIFYKPKPKEKKSRRYYG